MPLNGLSPWHLLILVVVLVLIFGSKKLPDAARSLGKSMRIFKSEIKEMQSDSKPGTTGSATPIASERVDPGHPAPGPDVAGHPAPGSEHPARGSEHPSDKRPA